jgi:AraC-like DNA-binding protein
MRWSLERMMQELREPQPGGDLVAQHLAWMMLIQSLRLHLAEGLAECAGMSRSTFALKFKQTVGKTPMEYLTNWRMLLAGDKLANSSDPVSASARSLGYESETAFSTAFRRVMNSSPQQYIAAILRSDTLTYVWNRSNIFAWPLNVALHQSLRCPATAK